MPQSAGVVWPKRRPQAVAEAALDLPTRQVCRGFGFGLAFGALAWLSVSAVVLWAQPVILLSQP